MRTIRTLTVVFATTALLTLPTLVQAQSTDVEVTDNAFVPETVTITAGDTVTWSVTGTNPHTITADDGSFDQAVSTGDTFEQTFDTPGTYSYHCTIHGAAGGVGMSGTVVVQAADSASPTPTTTATPAPSPTSTAAPATGSLTLSDQSGDGTTVVVDEVTIEGSDGFVVVHADQDGAPGPVLGHAAIPEGTTSDLAVPMDTPLTSDQTVWPMLHVDAGTPGTYEFPGADGPVTVDGQVVVSPLSYSLAAGDDAAADDELPATGRTAWPLVVAGLLAIALGAGAVGWRRRQAPDSADPVDDLPGVRHGGLGPAGDGARVELTAPDPHGHHLVGGAQAHQGHVTLDDGLLHEDVVQARQGVVLADPDLGGLHVPLARGAPTEPVQREPPLAQGGHRGQRGDLVHEPVDRPDG